jgi:hypothetical protein
MKTNTNSYRGYRFPREIISHSVWAAAKPVFSGLDCSHERLMIITTVGNECLESRQAASS